MIYEIVNPSDACTIEAPSDAIAVAATLLLGEGFYGLRDETGRTLRTMVFLGGEDALNGVLKEYAIGQTGADLDEFLRNDENRKALAKTLDSLSYCKIGERRALLAAFEDLKPSERRARLKRYNDERRSSLNDINARAAALAHQFSKPAVVFEAEAIERGAK